MQDEPAGMITVRRAGPVAPVHPSMANSLMGVSEGAAPTPVVGS